MADLDAVDLSLRFRWAGVGAAALDRGGRLVLPALPGRPGLYRFLMASTADAAAYIGEAEDLHRRMTHYRNPGPSQSTNLRLNALLRQCLQGGGAVEVATVGAVDVQLTREWRPLDLSQRAGRLLAENAALLTAAAAGLPVHNL